MEDSLGNNYTFSYSNVNDTLVRQVTDPSGRWLKVTYLNQGGFAQQRVTLGSSPAESGGGRGQSHNSNILTRVSLERSATACVRPLG
jgi:hypothetical protein